MNEVNNTCTWSPTCKCCHQNQRMQKIYLKVCWSTTFLLILSSITI